jgi:hypothetical protein
MKKVKSALRQDSIMRTIKFILVGYISSFAAQHVVEVIGTDSLIIECSITFVFAMFIGSLIGPTTTIIELKGK